VGFKLTNNHLFKLTNNHFRVYSIRSYHSRGIWFRAAQNADNFYHSGRGV